MSRRSRAGGSGDCVGCLRSQTTTTVIQQVDCCVVSRRFWPSQEGCTSSCPIDSDCIGLISFTDRNVTGLEVSKMDTELLEFAKDSKDASPVITKHGFSFLRPCLPVCSRELLEHG
jgi:hypothetical protein